ncbi:MFS transporter [Chitinophagaceae bacterium LWZ2-11]
MKRTLYVLALGIFGVATTEFGVIGILPQIAEAFNVTIDKAGWLLSSFALVIFLFAPVVTLFFVRFDRKKTLLLSLLFFVLSNILSALVNNFDLLLFAHLLPAFFHPVFWSIGLSTAASSVPKEQAPKAVSIVFGGFTIASVLGIPMSTYIADLFTWRAAFIMGAGINVVSFVGLLFFLPKISSPAQSNSETQLTILKRKSLWVRLALAFLMISAMYSSYGYFAGYLKDITKMNGAEISLMLVLFGVAGVCGNWMAGKLLSKSIETTTLLFIISLCLIHVVIYFGAAYFIPMTLIVCLWGFINTGGFLISNVNVASQAPEAPEFVNSIFTSCGNLAVTAGTTIGGLVIAHAGIKQIVWAAIGLLLIALFTFFYAAVGKAKRISMTIKQQPQ